MNHNPPQSNESKIRLTAFFVLALILAYMGTGIVWLPVFLVVDFALRGFNLGAYSPLANISGLLVRWLRMPIKPVYMPPKRFAARIGLAFSIAIVILHIAAHPLPGPGADMHAASLSTTAPGSDPNIAPFSALAPKLHDTALPALVLSAVLALFAALESLANFCAGCYVYNGIVWLRTRRMAKP
jgi:hypothetical protein